MGQVAVGVLLPVDDEKIVAQIQDLPDLEARTWTWLSWPMMVISSTRLATRRASGDDVDERPDGIILVDAGFEVVAGDPDCQRWNWEVWSRMLLTGDETIWRRRTCPSLSTHFTTSPASEVERGGRTRPSFQLRAEEQRGRQLVCLLVRVLDDLIRPLVTIVTYPWREKSL